MRRIIIVATILTTLSCLFLGGTKPSYAQTEETIDTLQGCYNDFQTQIKTAVPTEIAGIYNQAVTCLGNAVASDDSIQQGAKDKAAECFNQLTPVNSLNSGLSCLSRAFPGFIFVPRPTGALDSLPTILSAGIRLILIVAGLIAFFILLMGGIKWITSGGDKGQVEAARGQILQALIGLIVVLATWGLIVIVQAATNICLGFGCDLVLPTLY